MRYCYYHFYISDLCGFLCSINGRNQTRQTRVSIAHKPGFTGLKNGRVTRVFGAPGLDARVFPDLWTPCKSTTKSVYLTQPYTGSERTKQDVLLNE